MNKKISTLLAGVALMSAMSVSAVDLKDGYYYHLQTPQVGADASKQALNLVLTKNYLGTNDSIIAVVATEADAMTDYAMWKTAYVIDPVTGEYTYTITNKAVPTAQFSFATGSNVKGDDATLKINNADAAAYGLKEISSLSGSMKFAWGAPKGTSVVDAASLISSYVQAKDSTMFLAVKLAVDEDFGTNKKFPLIQVMAKGNKPATPVAGDKDQVNPIVSLKAVAPASRLLTADELNDKLGNDKGFQLFFYHKNTLTNENNPLTNVIFEAENGTAGVLLKAKTIAPKNEKHLYAYLDTISYSSSTNLPALGERMTFKVDTLPTTDGTTGILTPAAYTFNFIVDPSNPKDSVAVFVNASYNPSAAGVAPHTYTVISETNKAFPLQIDAFGGTSKDKAILTTATTETVFNTYPTLATAPTLSENTRISFTGPAIDPLFDASKVYSIKVVSEKVDGTDNAGKYVVVAPTAATTYGETYSNMVFDHLPSTQFVYDGSQMVNRELSSVTTNALYAVEGKTGVYTNLSDTFEIKAMTTVNLQDSTMGFAHFTKDSLINYAFSFDYVSGILEGRSINMMSDSMLVATTEGSQLFKLEEVDAIAKLTAGADIEEVKAIYNQAYKIYTKDMKYVVTIPTTATNKLALTSVKSGLTAASFYLKDTENKGEFILVNGTNKYNVNSTNETLETVGLNQSNNAFAVQVEKAPKYVLDAKGHYNIENLRGDMLAADAKGFGMFRKEGELKAAYEKKDFALYIDTAKIHKTEPSYFILSGAKTGEGSELEGNFLRVMTDSIDVEGYKADNGFTRLAFVPAKREATSDSLLVNFQNEVLTTKDSVDYKRKNTGKIAQFQFKIQYTNVEGEYLVENAAGYLATYNDVLCLAKDIEDIENKDAAQLIKLTKVDAPTSNEGVEVSEITVIAGEGNVTIAGAAGKKVVISNILGQVVANTVISSDNATIAAPQGVVVIAVEGEEAVKAIVK